MSSFTKGKWTFDGKGVNVDGCRIATLTDFPEIERPLDSGKFVDIEPGEKEKNGLLMSHAPDLLECLAVIIMQISIGTVRKDDVIRAQQLIFDARGGDMNG